VQGDVEASGFGDEEGEEVGAVEDDMGRGVAGLDVWDEGG
jgi:hypothetical protein